MEVVPTPVWKEGCNVISRILDHRAFVNGEIESALHSFETLRDDKEVVTLFKVAETVAELKVDLSDKCIYLSNLHLSSISKSLQRCLSDLEAFVNENRHPHKPSELLERSRHTRLERRDIFCDDLKYKYSRVESTFEEKEEEIAVIYSDLQRKLNIQD